MPIPGTILSCSSAFWNAGLSLRLSKVSTLQSCGMLICSKRQCRIQLLYSHAFSVTGTNIYYSARGPDSETKAGLAVTAVKNFLWLLKTSPEERRRIIMANLHTRLDSPARSGRTSIQRKRKLNCLWKKESEIRAVSRLW